MVAQTAELQKSARLRVYCSIENTCRSGLGNEESLLVSRLLPVPGNPEQNRSKETFVPDSFDEKVLNLLVKYGMSKEDAMESESEKFVTLTHAEVPEILRQPVWYI
jgi:hypothetical protein